MRHTHGSKDLNGIDSLDQYLSAQGAWTVTPTTTIEASDDFAYGANINTLFDNAVSVRRWCSSASESPRTAPTRVSRIGWDRSGVSVPRSANQLFDYQRPAPVQHDCDDRDAAAHPWVHAEAGRRRGWPVPAPGVRRGRLQSESRHDVLPGLRRAELQHQSHLDALGAGGSCVRAARLDRGRRRQPALVSRSRSQHLPEARGRDARVHPVPAERRRPLLASCLSRSPRARAVGGTRCPPRLAATSHSSASRSVGSSLNYFGTISHRQGVAPVARQLGYSRSASNSSGLNASTVLDRVQWHSDLDPVAALELDASMRSTRCRRPLNEVPQREVALRARSQTSRSSVVYLATAILRRPVRGGHGRVDHQRRGSHHHLLRR